MVVAETIDKWRKIRDVNGDECWAFHTTLTERNHALALRQTRVLARRDEGSFLRGRLEEGALVRISRVAEDDAGRFWVHVNNGALRGWTPAIDLWGANIASERRRNALVTSAIAAAPN